MSISPVVLAQLAAAAYRETSPQNRIDPPPAWTQIWVYPDEAQTTGGAITGFSAAAFRNTGGEIVIAYTGTNGWKDWPGGNLPAAVGTFSPQVVQAAQFYWDVRQRFGPNIRFTGHSLGGGNGEDQLDSGADDDLLFGDDGDDRIDGDGVVLADYLDSTPQEHHCDDRLDGGAGNDHRAPSRTVDRDGIDVGSCPIVAGAGELGPRPKPPNRPVARRSRKPGPGICQLSRPFHDRLSKMQFRLTQEAR